MYLGPTVPKPGPTLLSVAATLEAQSINLWSMCSMPVPPRIQVASGSVVIRKSQLKTKISKIISENVLSYFVFGKFLQICCNFFVYLL